MPEFKSGGHYDSIVLLDKTILFHEGDSFRVWYVGDPDMPIGIIEFVLIKPKGDAEVVIWEYPSMMARDKDYKLLKALWMKR